VDKVVKGIGNIHPGEEISGGWPSVNDIKEFIWKRDSICSLEIQRIDYGADTSRT
jgi:hypothetical protein